ncbi:MAG: hypothetical protein KatS3mg092_0825 [Patescibacteria group bacterium]|nr:MAG: hypothetical protein KatS3mg092_0825 [Patescibacteria group bacterium]
MKSNNEENLRPKFLKRLYWSKKYCQNFKTFY